MNVTMESPALRRLATIWLTDELAAVGSERIQNSTKMIRKKPAILFTAHHRSMPGAKMTRVTTSCVPPRANTRQRGVRMLPAGVPRPVAPGVRDLRCSAVNVVPALPAWGEARCARGWLAGHLEYVPEIAIEARSRREDGFDSNRMNLAEM